MADELKTEEPPEVVDATSPAPTPEPDPTPEPSAVDLLAEARERAARLEGEIAALRAAQAPKPVQTAQTRYTPDQIETAYQANQITDVQRIAAHARLQAEEVHRQGEATRRRDEAARHVQAALQGYYAEHPELTVTGSALQRQVVAEFGVLAQRDPTLDPNNPATALLAIERVLGPKRITDARELGRRRMPVGGVGGGMGSGPTGAKADPLAKMPKALLAQWQRQGYTRAQMLEEAPYVNLDRWARVASA